MFLPKLAFRNILRQWRRSGLSLVSIVVGVMVLVAGRGFTGGLKENVIRAQVDTVSGHVLARPADYPTAGMQHPVGDLIELDEDTRQWLDEESEAWTGRVMFTPRLVSGRDALRVRAFGIDAEEDAQVFPRDNWNIQGCAPQEAGRELLISTGVAGLLELEIGDSVVLESRTHAGAINALEVPVCGTVSTANMLIDNIGVFASRPLVDELVQPRGGYSHVAMRLNRRSQATDTAKELAAKLGSQAEVTTWEEETEDLVHAQELRQQMLDFIALALMGIAATGIANTVLMAAYERMREIGTLRALGLTKRGVVGLFVLEGLVMGVIGASLGAALGGLISWHYSRVGIDMAPMIEQANEGGGYDNIAFSTMLYMEFSPTMVAIGFAFGTIVAVLASIYPAVVASRLTPANAVRA